MGDSTERAWRPFRLLEPGTVVGFRNNLTGTVQEAIKRPHGFIVEWECAVPLRNGFTFKRIQYHEDGRVSIHGESEGDIVSIKASHTHGV